MSFELVVQQSIYEKLKSNAQIIAAAIEVYDDVPQAPDSGAELNFPYIVIGDDSLQNWDTDTENGMQAAITVHTWSRYSGKKEIKELQGLVYGCLHGAEFTIVGYESVVCVCEDSKSFLDSDGKTRHGVQTFKMLIEET